MVFNNKYTKKQSSFWAFIETILRQKNKSSLSRIGANKNGYEAAFANPENNKTGLLDDNLPKKITLKTISMGKDVKRYGKIYEISFPSGKFTYVCRVRQYEFGIF